MLLPSHPLVQFKCGDHICLFYRDEAVLAETLAAYLATGLRNGERCFCAQKSSFIPRLKQALKRVGVDVPREIMRGALDIHTEEEVYFAEGHFEPESMMALLERSIEQAHADGFTGFRTAGEMSWVLKGTEERPNDHCDQLIHYEKLVQAAFPGKTAIGLCQYPIHDFPPHVLNEVLDSHRVTLEETMVGSNHSTLTIRSGGYLADIVTDRVNPGNAFHYVIQKSGDAEVLSWGVEPTIERAMISSESILTDFGANRASSMR
jgi:MEDS: MEthanogen/methylotroph, DcmR Sensory domain